GTRVKRALVLLVVLGLAGCGGGSSTPSRPATVKLPASDPGKDAVDALVAAARAGKVQAIWGMLSPEAKHNLGPTLGEFQSGAGGELADSLASFRSYKVVVSERITPEFGVGA